MFLKLLNLETFLKYEFLASICIHQDVTSGPNLCIRYITVNDTSTICIPENLIRKMHQIMHFWQNVNPWIALDEYLMVLIYESSEVGRR